MDKKNTVSIIAFVVILVAIIGAIAYSAAPKSPKTQASLDKFAMCLASKKLTMYGASWCPHCQAEKALFGSSFEKVPYVECPDNLQMCIDKGVQGYPTWITASSTKYEGEQTLEKLSEISGCPLSQ